MDTGLASRSETFRISGERGRVYVGTFHIPYSRGILFALSLVRSPTFLLSSSSSSSFCPFLFAIATRKKKKTRDLRYDIAGCCCCCCWLASSLAGWWRRYWWCFRMPRSMGEEPRERRDKVRSCGILIRQSRHRRCGAWPIYRTYTACPYAFLFFFLLPFFSAPRRRMRACVYA